MRTLFTSQDIKDIVRQVFNGNLEQHRLNPSVEYENPNSEPIILINEETGEEKKKDLAEYLNLHFYSWKNRLIEKSEHSLLEEPSLMTFDAWVQSLNVSMDEAYALVELVDEEATPSQDIDSATKYGQITFLVQADKVSNLDYYVTKIRNSFLGNPQDIQNSCGNILKAYISLGSLVYTEAPSTMQLGECVIVTSNFSITYLTNALTYNDTQILLSFDGDDVYDELGNIVGSTKYKPLALTKTTWQNIVTSKPLPTSQRPDLTGFVATAVSCVKTFSFYDFDKDLTMRINDLFWRWSCYRYDGIIEEKKDVNIPVYVKVVSNGHSYVFKDVIDNMEKVITNNDFNISTITLKGWGKIQPLNS